MNFVGCQTATVEICDWTGVSGDILDEFYKGWTAEYTSWRFSDTVTLLMNKEEMVGAYRCPGSCDE